MINVRVSSLLRYFQIQWNMSSRRRNTIILSIPLPELASSTKVPWHMSSRRRNTIILSIPLPELASSTKVPWHMSSRRRYTIILSIPLPELASSTRNTIILFIPLPELASSTNSPVNLMFDLELIATENRPTPFETIWLLYTPCSKFRQKSRQGKSKKREEKSCQISARERFTAGLPYPGIFYVYALTVIPVLTESTCAMIYRKNKDKQMLQSVLVVSKNKISDSINEVIWDIAQLLIVRSIYFTINQKMTHYSDDVMKNILKQKDSGILR